jgi:hypothetical protein
MLTRKQGTGYEHYFSCSGDAKRAQFFNGGDGNLCTSGDMGSKAETRRGTAGHEEMGSHGGTKHVWMTETDI